MNVIILNESAHVDGGSSLVAIVSAKELARRGHRVIFFCADATGADDLEKVGVEVVATRQHLVRSNPNRIQALRQGLWNTRAQAVMRQLLQRLPAPDTLLHTHGWVRALSASVLPEARRAGVQTVSTLHDYVLACPSGDFFDFREHRICTRRPLSLDCLACNCDPDAYANNVYRSVRQIIQAAYARVPAMIRHYIYLSELSLEVLRPFLPVDAHFYKLDNPIDAVKAAPIDVATNARFAYLGRLLEQKGVKLLARAAAAANLQVTFVGEGRMREAIAAACPACVITGWLPRREVYRQLRQARAMVFPSLWYEVQPLTLLEAASQGLPAVVSDVCAGRELVADGETGLWFRGGDAADLTDKLRALEDDALVVRLGRQAYEQYWDNPFTVERHVDELEKIYGRVLADETSGQPRSLAKGVAR